MKGLKTQAPGGWENTRIIDLPDPIPGQGQVVVEIRAAGLNPADGFLIEGRYPGGPKPPFICGRDAAGVIVQGDAAGAWKPGEAVVVLQSQLTNLADGSFAQRQLFPVEVIAPLPDGWSFEEGGAAPLTFQTAWQALNAGGPLSAGRVVVVTGASGGVGLAAVQLAIASGAIVVGLSRSAEKRERLTAMGANFAIDSSDPDLKKKVFAAVGKPGVDVVVECVGGAMLGSAVHMLGNNGVVSVVGILAGVEGVIPIPSLMFKVARIQGILVSSKPPVESSEDWRQIVEILAKAKTRPVIDSTYPLSEFRAAFAKLASSPFGKVVFNDLGG